jgi:hypothetical protein
MLVRGGVALVSAVLAAAAGLATNVYSTGWAWPWGIALAVLVVAGVVLQLASDPARRLIRASGAGSVAVGGTVRGPVRTNVRRQRNESDAGYRTDGVIASGPGAVAVGGDVDGAVDTSAHGEAGGPAR